MIKREKKIRPSSHLHFLAFLHLLCFPNSQPSCSCSYINTFSFFLFLFISFYFFLFPQLPTLFPPGKGPFASLARVPVSPPPHLSPSRMRGSIFILRYCLQAHPLRWVDRFLLLSVYLGQLVLRQSSCDGEAPLQLLHLNL